MKYLITYTTSTGYNQVVAANADERDKTLFELRSDKENFHIEYCLMYKSGETGKVVVLIDEREQCFRQQVFEKHLKDAGISISDEDGGCQFEYESSYASTYISSLYKRHNKTFFRCGFNENSLTAYNPAKMGFILSSLGYNDGAVDHAPDAAEILIGLDFIPDDIDVIVAIDRRGKPDFAGKLLSWHINHGATVIWDGMGLLDAIVPAEYIKRISDWNSGYGYSSHMVYAGELTDDVAKAYINALKVNAALYCQFMEKLITTGNALRHTSHYLTSEIGNEELTRAVKTVTLGRVDLGEMGNVSWGCSVRDALEDRKIELHRRNMVSKEDLTKIKIAYSCAYIWDKILANDTAFAELQNDFGITGENGFVKISRDDMIEIGRKLGIESMIDALEVGVPVEDIVG